MKSQTWRPTPACAQHVRYVSICIGAILLLAAPALADTIRVNSYSTWQWNRFSWSPTSTATKATTSQTPTLSALTYSALLTPVASDSVGASSLSGYMYVDRDNDGTMDSNDWAICEAKISLTQAGSTEPLLTVTTGADGSYSFASLLPGDYTITVLTRSNQPGQDTLGTLFDKDGNVVSTGTGTIAKDSFADIHFGAGYTGVNYNFADLVYPVQLLSKRMLLNNDPGVHVVPEPGSLVLLAIAGLLFSGLTGRRRRLSIG